MVAVIQSVLRYHGVFWNRCCSRKLSLKGWRWVSSSMGMTSGVGWRFCGQGLLSSVGERRSNRVVMPHMGAGFHAGVMAGSDGEDVYEEVEEEVALPETCPGCGVKLQIEDPNAPGCVMQMSCFFYTSSSENHACMECIA